MKVSTSWCISGGRWQGEMPNNGGDGETCSGKHVEGQHKFPPAIMVSPQEHYQLLQQQEKRARKTTQEH